MFSHLNVNFSITNRRRIFTGLVILTITSLLALMYATLSTKGLTPLEFVMLICFFVTIPWLAVGFWNAFIGLALMRFSKDSASIVNPILAEYEENTSINKSTAIVSCIRNEDTSIVMRNLEGMLLELEKAGMSGTGKFTLYVLSDSSNPDIIEDEKIISSSLQNKWNNEFDVVYRHREVNNGFKAGNIRDFCNQWGHLHDFMLIIDADSYMSANSILKLVKLMQTNPSVGILQSLVVGMPTKSPFARVFQYGMRLGMRSYTIGSAWWQGDCGPYWGHNALIRLKPFIAECELSELKGHGPLSGTILSHDQVEAALMRRAGYEVRIVPEEGESFEENPTSLPEFILRDLRWCQGNLQYFKLLRTPGLKPVSRWNLILAILMFIGSPAWLLFMLTGALAVILYGRAPIMVDDTLVSGTLEDQELLSAILEYDSFNHSYGLLTIMIIMLMVFAPKLATVIDILFRRNLRQSFGGTVNILVSTTIEIVFSAMLAPVMAVSHSIFIVGLLFGRKIGWSTQHRNARDLSVMSAFRHLWPQTLLGLVGVVFIVTYSSGAVLFALPVILGLVISIPFAVTSASSRFSKWFEISGLWCIPEEQNSTNVLMKLNQPVLNTPVNSSGDELPSKPAIPVIARDKS